MASKRPALNIKRASKMNTKWITNAMKSIGASTGEVFKDIAPTIYETGSTITSSVKDIAAVSKGSGNTSIANTLKNNKYIGYAKKGFENALEDLKTGNFNNEDRMNNDMMKAFGFDDFDFGDNDGGGTTFNYIDEGSDDAYFNLSETIQKTTEANIKAQKASTDAMIATASVSMLATQEMGKEMITHLGNINNGITALVDFHRENTMKFYETSIAAMERLGTLAEESQDASKDDASTIFKTNGTIDPKKYKEYVKKNIKSAFKDSQLGSVADIILSNDDMIEMAISNPLGFASKAIIKGMVPHMVTNTIKGMEDAFKDFLPNMVAQLSEFKDNEIGGVKGKLKKLLGDIFGVKLDTNRGIDLSGKVTKDAAIFDGYTRNAIINTIPKHLSEMSGYLKSIAEHFEIDTEKVKSNRDVFDPDSGTFMKIGDYQKNIVKGFTESLTDALSTSEFGKLLKAGGKELRGKDAEAYNKVLEQIAHGMDRSEKNITAADMDMDNKNSIMSRMMKVISKGADKNTERAVNVAVEAMRKMYKENLGQDIAAANFSVKMAGNRYKDEFESDDYKSLTAQIKNLSEVSDRLLGYTGYEVNRKERNERLKAEEDAKNAYEYKHRTKGSAKKLAAKGMQDSYVYKEKKKENYLVENAEAIDVPGLITNTGNHAIKGMRSVMAGDTKTAVKEFASIFSDSMKTFWGSIKTNFLTPIKESIFGKKNADGYIENGLFSGVQNKAKDIWNELGSKITGKGWTDSLGNKHDADPENSVFGKVQSVAKKIGDGIKYRLFGSDKDKDSKIEKTGGAVNSLFEKLKLGVAGWGETLFGKDPEKSKEELYEEYKKKAMDMVPSLGAGAIAGAGVGLSAGGLLGTIVGGPLMGAGLGVASSILFKSNKFQNYLFGEEIEDENGNKKRAGGLISAKTQELFKNKSVQNSVIGGAALGFAKNMVLGSSGGVMGMLVGGPIAGAMMGAGLGLLKESQMFKDFMYGNEEKGKEGFKNKIKKHVTGMLSGGEKDEEKAKKTAGMKIIGGGVGGVMGLMMGGPIGAIAGLSVGISAAGKKFKTWMFGEKDEEGNKTKEGVVGKVGNWIHTEVVAPMKSKVLEIGADAKSFLTHKIFNKLTILMNPIMDKLKDFGDKLKSKAGAGLKFVKKLTIDPVLKVANAVVFKPIRKVVSGITSVAYKMTKKVIELPVKILEKAIVHPFLSLVNHVKKGVNKVIDIVTKPFRAAGKFALNIMKSLGNKAKTGVKRAARFVGRKAEETLQHGADKISGGRINISKIKRKFTGSIVKDNKDLRKDLQSEEIAYLEEKQKNREEARLRKRRDKMRQKMAKTLGYEEKYLTEENWQRAIDRDSSLKGLGSIEELRKAGLFEKTPEQIAKEEQTEINKKRSDAIKLSSGDLANAKVEGSDIEVRQLQETSRIAVMIGKILEKMGISTKFSDKIKDSKGSSSSDNEERNNSATKDDETNGTENNTNDSNNEESNEEDDSDTFFGRLNNELNEKGIDQFLKDKFSAAKDKIKNVGSIIKDKFSSIKSKFSRSGKARAEGGNVDEDKAYLVGDGGKDPEAAEIFVPKTNGKILSQKNGGIKVSIESISKKAQSEIGNVMGGESETNPGAYKSGNVGSQSGASSSNIGFTFPGLPNFGDESDSDDIAVAATKANSEPDYDENGNLIEEHADLSTVNSIKDPDKKKDAIIDADNASDLANAKNAGSFATRMAKDKAKKDDENQAKVLDALKGIGSHTEGAKSGLDKFSDMWSGIFSKKGLLTIAAIGLLAKFPGLFDMIMNIGKGVMNILSNIFKDTTHDLDKTGDAGNGTGAYTDNGTATDERNRKLEQITSGNLLMLNEDGTASGTTSTAVKFWNRRGLNFLNSNKKSITDGKLGKVEKRIYNTIKSAGSRIKNGATRVSNFTKTGEASISEYEKIMNAKGKNGVTKVLGTDTYLDDMGRQIVSEDEWKDLVAKNGDEWAEKNFDKFNAPDIEDFAIRNKSEKKGFLNKTKSKYKGKYNKIKNADEIGKQKYLEKYEKKLAEKTRKKAEQEAAEKAGKEAAEKAGQETVEKAGKKIGQEAAEEAAEKASKELAENAGKELAENTAKKVGQEGAEEVGGTLFKKVCGYISEFFSKFLGRICEKMGKKGAVSALKKSLGNLSEKGIVKALRAAWGKVSKQLGLFISGKLSAAAATLGTADLVSAAITGLDGISAAAKIFQVRRDDVDWTMRIISGAWGVFSGTTVGGVIDMVLSLLSSFAGDVFKALANKKGYCNLLTILMQQIYYFFKGGYDSEDSKALRENQDKLMDDYDKDKTEQLQKEFETQKKAGIIPKDLSFDEFCDGINQGIYHADAKSFEDYNTQKNGGIIDKTVDVVGGGLTTLKHGFGKMWGGTESYQDDKGNTYTKNKDGNWDVVDKSGNAIGSVQKDAIDPTKMKNTSTKGFGDTNAGKIIGSSVKSTFKFITSPIKNGIDSVKKVGGGIKKIAEGDTLGGIKDIGVGAVKSVFGTPIEAAKALGTGIKDSAKAWWGTAKDVGKGIHDFFTSEKEEVYRDPKDNTYYKSDGKNGFYHYNVNNQKITDEIIKPEEVILKFQSGELIKDTITTRESGISKTVTAIKEGLIKARDWIVDANKKVISKTIEFAGNVKDKATSAVKFIGSTIKKGATAVKNFFVGSEEEVYANPDGTYYNSKGEMFSKTGEKLEAGNITEEELAVKLKAGAVTKQTIKHDAGIKNLAKKAWSGLTNGIKKGWEGLKTYASGVKDKFGKLKDAFTEFAKDPLGSVKNFFTSTTKDGFMSPEGDYYIIESNKTYTHYSATGGILEKDIKMDSEEGKKIQQQIKNGTLILTKITDKSGFSKIGENFQNAIKDGWDNVKNTASNIWSGIKSFFGGNGDDSSADININVTGGSGNSEEDEKRNVANHAQKIMGGHGEENFAETFDQNISSGWKRLYDAGKSVGGFGDEKYNGFSYYSQKDPSWADKEYSSGGNVSNMSSAGCGPTAMAMVASELTGKNYKPTDMAKDAIAGGFRDETGTNSTFINKEADKLNITNNTMSDPSASYISNELSKGHPMILNGVNETGDKSSAFTRKGHYIVAVGKTPDGNIIVNDPRGKKYSKLYDPNELASQTRLSWSFNGNPTSSSGGGYGYGKKIGGHGKTATDKNWLDIVAKAKKSIGDQKKGYSQSGYIDVTVDGKTINTRRDCSGFVSVCLSFYTGKKLLTNSDGFESNANVASYMKNAGFSKIKWTGWNDVKAGDIFVKGGSHVEICAKDATHEVYNCGSDKSCNSPGATNSGHSSYNYIWRPGEAGSVGNDLTSEESTDDSATTETSTAENPINSIADILSSHFSAYAQKANSGMATGKWDYDFSKVMSGDSSSSSTTSSDTSSSETTSVEFPKYTLTDEQKKGIANIVAHEQGSKEGRYAEASLIANRTDISGDEKTADDIVKTVTGGWFADGKNRYSNPGNVPAEALQAVEDVIIGGKRTIPRFVDEHDCITDIASVKTNGKNVNIKDKKGYKQNDTIIKNKMKSTYTFWDFPNTTDPFGYTNKKHREKWGEGRYDMSGKPIGMSDDSGGNMSGNSVAEKVYNFYRSKGYSPEAASGIIGNFVQESGLNSKSIQGNGKGPAAGIAQWENYNTKSARWKNLDTYAKKQGKQWTDLETQLTFVDKELKTQNPYFKMNKSIENRKTAPTTYADWKKSNDVTDATYQFEKAFERAGKPNMSRRVSEAKKYYKQFGGKGGFGDDEIDTQVDYSSNHLRNFSSQAKRFTSSNTGQSGPSTNLSTLEHLLSEVVGYLKSIDGSSTNQLEELKNITSGKTSIATNNSTNVYNDNRVQQQKTNMQNNSRESRNSVLARLLAQG